MASTTNSAHPHHCSQDKTQNDSSLDKTFEKMQKLGIPADIFGNIHPNWRSVMRNYFNADEQTDKNTEEQFDKAIEKIGRHCQTKYSSDQDKVEDCHEQAQLRIINGYQKPKELSEILLCNFANKCLIRGNTVEFCTEEVMKEKKVINAECLKKLHQIEEYL